jgi:hypothetical protein
LRDELGIEPGVLSVEKLGRNVSHGVALSHFSRWQSFDEFNCFCRCGLDCGFGYALHVFCHAD